MDKVIVAKVSISGSRSQIAGWRLCRYIYDTERKVCRFDYALTYGMYPNKHNEMFTASLIDGLRKQGTPVVNGRPTHKRLVALGIV